MIVFFFLIAPLIELLVAFELTRVIGWLPVLAWIAVALVAGWSIAKRQGLDVWRRVSGSLREGRVPPEGTTDAFIKLFAGILILLPGVLSDVVGVALLVPPIRAAARRQASRRWLPARAARVGRVVVDTTARDDRRRPPPIEGH